MSIEALLLKAITSKKERRFITTLYKSKSFRESVEEMEEMLVGNPGGSEHYRDLGSVLYGNAMHYEGASRLDEGSKALAAYERAFDMSHALKDLNSIAKIFTDIFDRPAVAEPFHRLCVNKRPSARFHEDYGKCLYAGERYQEAIKQYMKALSMNDSGRIHYKLALCYAMTGEFDSMNDHEMKAIQKMDISEVTHGLAVNLRRRQERVRHDSQALRESSKRYDTLIMLENSYEAFFGGGIVNLRLAWSTQDPSCTQKAISLFKEATNLRDSKDAHEHLSSAFALSRTMYEDG